MTIPITKRVNDSRSKDLPVNQEVTKNSDGSGGPVDLPGGSPLKQVESYDKKVSRFESFEKGRDTLISGSSVNRNMAKSINKFNTSMASVSLGTNGEGGKGTVSHNIPEDQKTLLDNSTGTYRVDSVHNKKKLKDNFKPSN
jgi:hypothetical protein